MSQYIDGLYRSLQLQARKKLVEHLLKTEDEIKKLLEMVADDIGKELIRLEREGKWWQANQLLDSLLVSIADETETLLQKFMQETIVVGVAAGIEMSKQITIDILQKAGMDVKPVIRSYFRVHQEAVNEMNRRVIGGLNLSDRIWSNSRKVNQSLATIIRDNIAQGEHSVEIAKKLQRYVQTDAKTLVVEYPNMMERIGDMLPNSLSYEALRLARTETMAAYGQATKDSMDVLPSMQAVKWTLSNAGVACKKCVENSQRDVGNGPGIYEKHQLPDYPAHPNCMCVLIAVLEDTGDFVDRLIEWKSNPSVHPDIEVWYQQHYKPYTV